jgi:IS605 OrfB family transposase
MTTPQQAEAFSVLARLFADACNAMVPFVQAHRCWNRVALHHLVYYQVRATLPALGSQMVCQAIHRVADAYKALLANEGIPKDQPVPAITFTPASVHFDHRTYSLKGEAFSIFTAQGRDRCLASRRRLQSNGSRASKRKLKAISGREQRHVRHVNHVTSKAIVAQALQAGASILRMEDLTHIRARIKAGNRVRARLHRWAFRQLQDLVRYKVEAVGIKVECVEPAYTSQTCNVCGGRGERVKHRFACSCGNLAHSDVNASRNIARFAKLSSSARGVVNRPVFAHRV